MLFNHTKESQKLFGDQLEFTHAFLVAFLKNPQGLGLALEVFKKFESTTKTTTKASEFLKLMQPDDEERLSKIVKLAVASDVILFSAVGLIADYSLDRFELKEAAPILEPFVTTFAENLDRYHYFKAPLSFDDLKKFIIQASSDEMPFGMKSVSTLMSTIRVLSVADVAVPKYGALSTYESALRRLIRKILISGGRNRIEEDKMPTLFDLVGEAKLKIETLHNVSIEIDMPRKPARRQVPEKQSEKRDRLKTAMDDLNGELLSFKSRLENRNRSTRQESDDALKPSPWDRDSTVTKPTLEDGGRTDLTEPIDKGVREQVLEEAMEELDSLIGLDTIKTELKKLANFLKIQAIREERALPTRSQAMHLVFMGNPGTGKTTVARIVGKILFGLGYLNDQRFKEADRSTLVAGYLGQTAGKTNKLIDEALNGVLFVDEAYSLAGENLASGDAFGKEAISTLLKRMEDERDKLCIIAAGYPEPMERFLRSNPGLRSRFTRKILFDDYGVHSLLKIFRVLASAEEYKLTRGLLVKLATIIKIALVKKDETFGNARFVRSLFESIICQHSHRLAEANDFSDEELTTLRSEDLVFEEVAGCDIETSLMKWLERCPKCDQKYEGDGAYLFRQTQCAKCETKFSFDAFDFTEETLALVSKLNPVFAY